MEKRKEDQLKLYELTGRYIYPLMWITFALILLELLSQFPLRLFLVSCCSTLSVLWIYKAHGDAAVKFKGEEAKWDKLMNYVLHYGQAMLMLGILFKVMSWPASVQMLGPGVLATAAGAVYFYKNKGRSSGFQSLFLTALFILLAFAGLLLLPSRVWEPKFPPTTLQEVETGILENKD